MMWTIASCLLLILSLLPDAFASGSTPVLALPQEEGSQCEIGSEKCNRIIPEAQSYITAILNNKRYWVASGSRRPMPIATDMLYLEDDQALKDDAQRYVENCIRTHGYPGRCPPPGEKENEGSVSISVQQYRVDADDDPFSRVASTVSHWTSLYPTEHISQLVNFFDPVRTEKIFLDFAKMIHTRVWKVGCGVADYFVSAEEFQEMVACFYGPPKLKRGDKLYTVGSRPCSNCPSGTSCLTEGQLPDTLCKVDEGRTPVFEDQQTVVTPAVPSEGDVNGDDTSSSHNHRPESRRLIWRCDLYSYSEQCKVQRPCSSHWTVDTKGGFKYIKVSGTCTTASIFLQEIDLKGPSCFIFEYKKEGSKIDSRVTGFATQVNVPGVRSTSAREIEGGNDWQFADLDMPWSNIKVQIGIIVRSRSTTEEEQVIKVRNFEIYSGSCSENQ